MNATMRLAIHLALLAAAAGSAIFVWTRDDAPKSESSSEIVVWSGSASDVQRVVFEGSTRKVELEAHKDSSGQWFEGTATRSGSASDAGVDEPKTVRIVSGEQAIKLAEQLAPLRAIRNLGRLPDDKLKDFGLTAPSGTVTVVVGGKERKLLIGGNTPGGGDRYAKEPVSGNVFAIDGRLVRDLEAGEAALNERNLHAFENDDVQRVVIAASGKTREVLRKPGGVKPIWSNASSPDQHDEQVETWMTKVERLRPTEFVKDPPRPVVENENLVVRLEYMGKSGTLGFLDLLKLEGAEGARADYYIRTERTRGWAKVYPSVGEQVAADLASIIKQPE